MKEEALASDAARNTAQSLKIQLAFQRKWQRISSTAYVVTTLGILASSSGATLAASAKWSETAAYLAAVATVLVGFEKSMSFREKWKFHLGIATRLRVLESKWTATLIAPDNFIEEYVKILENYAENLPIVNHDNT
jgi:FtsH-binding integral membrane protein